jgi:hypothetical protein
MVRVWRCRRWKFAKFTDPHIRWEINPEFVRLAEFYEEIVSERVRRRTRDKQIIIDGWLAQICLQGLLTDPEIRVPYIPNIPLYSPIDPYGVRYDFYVPFLGSLEVKGTARLPYYKQFMVNIREWKKVPCDYGIGVKIRSDSEAVIMGWLPRDEIENLVVKNDGSGNAYYCDLTEMRTMSSFIEKLKAAKEELRKRERIFRLGKERKPKS